jgi:hypothetical protein
MTKKGGKEIVQNKGYWVDENLNKWDASTYDEATAKEMSDSLINCKICINCKNCKNCIWCIDCIDCRKCNFCRRCESCCNCKRCLNCQNCNDCRFCIDYKNKKDLNNITKNQNEIN